MPPLFANYLNLDVGCLVIHQLYSISLFFLQLCFRALLYNSQDPYIKALKNLYSLSSAHISLQEETKQSRCRGKHLFCSPPLRKPTRMQAHRPSTLNYVGCSQPFSDRVIHYDCTVTRPNYAAVESLSPA